MARGNDPGKDFDAQFNRNEARGKAKAERGEGPWAQDKYLRDLNSGSSGGSSAGGGCLLVMLSLLVLAVLGIANAL